MDALDRSVVEAWPDTDSYPTVIHDDPKLEEMRLEGVRRGILDPELPTDPKTYQQDLVEILLDDLRQKGLHRTVTLESTRMSHPEGRTPYSKPRPGARKVRR